MDGQGVTPPALPTLFQLVSLGGGGCGLWLGVLSLLSGGDYYPETWCDRGGVRATVPRDSPAPGASAGKLHVKRAPRLPGCRPGGGGLPRADRLLPWSQAASEGCLVTPSQGQA